MFLNRDFCMEKLLGKEVIIFRKKWKIQKFYQKFIKTAPDCKKNSPGVQTVE